MAAARAKGELQAAAARASAPASSLAVALALALAEWTYIREAALCNRIRLLQSETNRAQVGQASIIDWAVKAFGLYSQSPPFVISS